MSLHEIQHSEHFPDLVFRDRQGRAHKLSDFQGRVRVLHFWEDSWCPHPAGANCPIWHGWCAPLANERDIRFFFLPVREPSHAARAWLKAQGLDDLPLYEASKKALFLADERVLPD